MRTLRKRSKLKEVLEGGSVMERPVYASVAADTRPDSSHFIGAQSILRVKGVNSNLLNTSLPSIGSSDSRR